MLETLDDLRAMMDPDDLAIQYEIEGSPETFLGIPDAIASDELGLDNRESTVRVISADIDSLNVDDQIRDPSDNALYIVRRIRPGKRTSVLVLEAV